MGSGGALTLWSPSNEAGAFRGFLIDVRAVFCEAVCEMCVWLVSSATWDTAVILYGDAGLSLMVGLSSMNRVIRTG